MPDITPTPVDRTVVVSRHGALTWFSVALNLAILALIIIGIICHHFHHKAPGPIGGPGGGPGDRCAWQRQDRDRDFGGRHEGFGRHEFRNRDEGPGGDRFAGGPGGRHDPGMKDHQGWGGDREGGPGLGGDRHPGFNHMGGSDRGEMMPPPNANEMTDRFMLAMDQKLALTDQESAQIRPILQGQIEQFQKDMAAEKAAHQKMLDDSKAKIRAVLTPDQQKVFDQMATGFEDKHEAPTPGDKTPPAGK